MNDRRREFERRIAESGVKPITEFPEPGSTAWPEDEPIEPFLELIREIRDEADDFAERIANDPAWAEDAEANVIAREETR